MALFRYKAVSATGETIEGTMDAPNADDVIGKLQEAGHLPLAADPAQEGQGEGLSALFRKREMNARDQAQFTHQLATLLAAGQPLDRALQFLLEQPENPRTRKLIERVRESVRGGTSLSNALEQQHGVFSRLYVNLVRAGEASGSLDTTLRRLAEYLERSQSLRASVINALIYPAIILTAVGLVLIVLLAYVVPQFVPIFQDMGAELPLVTKAVVAVSDFLAVAWWTIPLVLAGLFLWLRRVWRDPESRRSFDERLLGIKVAGPLALKLETARLSRTLGTLLSNGVPMLTALSIARNVLGNRVLAEAVESASEDVKRGTGLSFALGTTKRFPRLALQMIAVGEESGALDEMLLKVAETFEADVRYAVDRALAGFAPAVTIFLALIVGMVIFSIMMPIMNMTDLMSG
jgi:general secretion pathway protein F